jgi:hypothetical protein
MRRQTKPDAHQMNLGLITDGPMNLPQRQRAELAAALADMLLRAVAAPETENGSTEAGDESETDC